MTGTEVKDREYRLKIYKGGYFPQVRSKREWFFIWGPWLNIGEHPGDDYGLYPRDHTSYPKTKEEANQICKDYNEWARERDVAKWTHCAVNIRPSI
jgi:hypothetical protein